MPDQVVKRTGAIVPFNRDRITNAIYRAAVAMGGRDRSTAERLADQVVAVLELEVAEGRTPSVEEIQDVVERVLIENGHARTAKAYILYREDRAKRRRDRARRSSRSTEDVPWQKLWEVLDWAVSHDVHTVEALNARIARGEFADIVREADHAYDEDVTCAAEMVRAREERPRVVIVAGPSSSGKTTTTTKLSHLLQRMGMTLVPLSVDNYFFDLEVHPRDEHGDYDYETPQALDLDMISEHLHQLVAGKEVRIPFYDFRTGSQYPNSTPMHTGEDEVILIDSLHGLYPAMTSSVDDALKFRIYIEPLLQLKGLDGEYVEWTDLRLMRRMVRDEQFRNLDAVRTLQHWHYVRSSEIRNIVPNVHTADYVINSGLAYELPIMKTRLFESFKGWAVQYKDDPLRQDAYGRSARVFDLLETITAVEDESSIPPDSLLREFIGGSCYEY